MMINNESIESSDNVIYNPEKKFYLLIYFKCQRNV